MLIPNNQICQAFDPIMILPEKAVNITDPMKMNTSCVAPAYVYLEGSRGKRFLCDYHFYFEYDATINRTPEKWSDIQQVLIDNLEKVKDTFSLDPIEDIENKFCWCKNKAYVKIIHKESSNFQFFCNFHYRKTYYRYSSNNQIFENQYDIFDQRYKMTQTIHEEMEGLTVI
jgi:hypothetical protein